MLFFKFFKKGEYQAISVNFYRSLIELVEYLRLLLIFKKTIIIPVKINDMIISITPFNEKKDFKYRLKKGKESIFCGRYANGRITPIKNNASIDKMEIFISLLNSGFFSI